MVFFFFFFGNWHEVQLLTGKAVRSAASQDTHLDKHLETVKDGVSTDNRVHSKENEDQREYVQFQTTAADHTGGIGVVQRAAGSVHQNFLDTWVGLSRRPSPSLCPPAARRYPLVSVRTGPSGPVRSTRAFPFQRRKPRRSHSGPAPLSDEVQG